VLRHSGQAEGDVACSDHVAAFSVTFCQVLYLEQKDHLYIILAATRRKEKQF